ncbi:unnamed protein product [Penicillium bialowiezense]
MVEPVGTTLGAVSLATAISGIFVSVVECYEFVELGRRFGSDFEKSQARLEALKLQLTRWGISAGALPDPQTGQCRDVKVGKDIADSATRLLAIIREDTMEIERKSDRYLSQSSSGSDQELAINDQNDMTVSVQSLMSRTNIIIAKRVNKLKWTRKTKWAVFDKRFLDTLLEDITGNLGLLEKLVPGEPRTELCRMEVDEVQDGQSQAVVELLYEASDTNGDTLLKQAVREALNSRVSGNKWERTETDGQLRQGSEFAMGYVGSVMNSDYGVTIGKANSIIHQGNSYGADKTIFFFDLD